MKKVNTLAIIQVESFIGLIHTHVVCIAFKERNPQTKLTLITTEKVAKDLQLQLSTTFNEIVYLDNEEEHFAKNNELPHDSFMLRRLASNEFDLTVNLSQSFFASSIHFSLKAKAKKGSLFNEVNEVIVNDLDGQFLLMANANQGFTDIHPVDIFKKILDVPSINLIAANKPSKHIIIELFFDDVTITKDNYSAFWSNLIYTLSKDAQNYQIILIGDNSNTHLAKQLCQMPIIKAYSDRVKNIVGKNRISDNYSLIKDASLFIGPNSYNLSLTSYFQTLSVCIGSLQNKPYAYNKNTYAIDSKKFADVAYLAEALLSASQTYAPKEIGFFFDIPNLGFLYSTESTKPNEASTCLKQIYQVIWGFYFFDQDLNLKEMRVSDKALKDLEATIFAIDQLTDLYKFGMNFSNRIIEDFSKLPKTYSSIQEAVVKIQEIDELANSLLAKFPQLRPIDDLVQIMKKNSPGKDLKDVASATVFHFQTGVLLLGAMSDLIKQTCNNQKNITKKSFEA